MTRPATDGIPDGDLCLICGDEMEDRRHVAVECFYNVHEVAPNASKNLVLVEVPEESSIWGMTRRYREGSRDRPVVAANGVTAGGTPITEVRMEQDPIPPVRLAEKHEFSVECCKTCRAEFLQVFGMWARGEMVKREQPGPEADIPVRDLGSIRFISMKEWEARRRAKERDDTSSS